MMPCIYNLESMETFYIGDTTRARGTMVGSVETMIFKDFVPFLVNGGWSMRMQHYAISETWPVKEEDVIRLDRNDTRMVR